MPHKEYRKHVGARTRFGGELLPSDVSVFSQLRAFIPGNPRRLWRIVTTFHIAQRVARHHEAHNARQKFFNPDLKNSVAASSAWRSKLLCFVLAGERWPARTAWLRHVIDRLVYHDDSWNEIKGPIPNSTPLILLHDSVIIPLLDTLCGHDDASSALLVLDDGSVQEFRKLIIGESLSVADFCAFDLFCRNNSNALLRHVATCSHRVWPSPVLLAAGSPSHCLSPPSLVTNSSNVLLYPAKQQEISSSSIPHQMITSENNDGTNTLPLSSPRIDESSANSAATMI